jgi:hypothetical protein
MFSAPDYVPFSDVADMCRRAADEAPNHEVARHLSLFRDWSTVDEEIQRKGKRAFGSLMADLIIQSGAELIICSPSGLTLTPSQRLLSIGRKMPTISLDDPLEAFLGYGQVASWRYEYLSTSTWCIERAPIDPSDVDIDEETGEVFVDPMDVVAGKFVGWALAIALDRSHLTASALLDARLAINVARATVLPLETQIGRPNKIDGALEANDLLYPEGHAAANASVKAVLYALKKEGHSISEPTLHRGLSSRKVNP